MIHMNYSDARGNFAATLDTVIQDCETVIITRRGAQPVAMLPAEELESMLENLRFLQSPKMMERLAASDAAAAAGEVEEFDV